jgi:hypothetical protein
VKCLFEWECPACGKLNNEPEVPIVVRCRRCGLVFWTSFVKRIDSSRPMTEEELQAEVSNG